MNTSAAFKTSDDPGFGIYVHWPFCSAKCPYCDFNSHVRHHAIDEQRYAAAFAQELSTLRARTGQRTISSIFFGGGTPSLMQPQTLQHILNAIDDHWIIPEGVEITLEANPTSVEADRFRGYRGAGVNRLSLGVQALNDADLRALGRLHSAEEAKAAIELARSVFPRLSFDLIYARPGQRLPDWHSELDDAINRAADHLSLYQLTIEQGTPFFSLQQAGKLHVPPPELAADLYELTQDVTASRGLPGYEISNHARPGAECRHNLVYWRYGDYVGVGPGAHGRFDEDGQRCVTIAARKPENWLSQVEELGHGITSGEILTPDQSADEFLLMGLRLVEGIDLGRFEQIAGRDLDSQRVTMLSSEGLVESPMEGRLRATPAGMMVLDALVADLAR